MVQRKTNWAFSKGQPAIGHLSFRYLSAGHNRGRLRQRGAIGTHEATHATEPLSNPWSNPNTPHTEDAPYKNQLEYYKELNRE
jgi:hypothetical protein